MSAAAAAGLGFGWQSKHMSVLHEALQNHLSVQQWFVPLPPVGVRNVRVSHSWWVVSHTWQAQPAPYAPLPHVDGAMPPPHTSPAGAAVRGGTRGRASLRPRHVREGTRERAGTRACTIL